MRLIKYKNPKKIVISLVLTSICVICHLLPKGLHKFLILLKVSYDIKTIATEIGRRPEVPRRSKVPESKSGYFKDIGTYHIAKVEELVVKKCAYLVDIFEKENDSLQAQPASIGPNRAYLQPFSKILLTILVHMPGDMQRYPFNYGFGCVSVLWTFK